MFHEPVLLKQVVELLVIDKSGTYLDGTLGGGGHAEAIVEQLDDPGKLIGLDLDDEAISHARSRLKGYKQRMIFQQWNFREAGDMLNTLQIKQIQGMLLDLGMSSHQIDSRKRGFGFSVDSPLDMRMNTQQKLTAYDIANSYSETELSALFKEYGEERHFRAIARAIVKQRTRAPIRTTAELRDTVSKVLPPQKRVKSLARIFQALRIAVNDELNNLSEALNASVNYLAPGGRMVVISYHSLEDRIVKNFFKQESSRCVCPPEFPLCVCGKKGRLRILTKKALRPSDDEVRRNPRSRSARLRAAERVRGA